MMRHTLMQYLFALAACALVAGCAGGQMAQTVADPAVQQLAGQVAVARALEASDDPAAAAERVLVLTDATHFDGPVLVSAVRNAVGYDGLPASEQLLFDAMVDAALADAATLAPESARTSLAHWRDTLREGAKAVLRAERR